jgi:hypothetical protein
LHFTPRESVSELEAMVENAGSMVGFGYEITLLRRYVALTHEGYRWLLPTPTTACPPQRPNPAAPSCGRRQAWRERCV